MPSSGLAWDCHSIKFCHASFSCPAFSRHRWRSKGPNWSRALPEATLIVRDKAKARTQVLWLVIPGCFLDTPSQPPHSLNYLSHLQTCNPFVEIKAKRKQPKVYYIVQTCGLKAKHIFATEWTEELSSSETQSQGRALRQELLSGGMFYKYRTSAYTPGALQLLLSLHLKKKIK